MLKSFAFDTRSAASSVLAIALLSLAIGTPAHAQGAGAVVPLSAQMAANAEKYLPGVVGEPVPAFTIDPALASLAAGTRTFEIVSGDDAGQLEQHVIAPLPRDATGTRWRYTVGQRTVFLNEVQGQSLGIVSEEDSDQGVLTRYRPPEPLLIAGMNAGDSRTMAVDVRVYDLNDPEDLEHKGTINLTFTYVGAYKVTVPAGTFEAALLRWDYNGEVGPASIEDIQARFVAPDVGMVAMAGKRDIAAMLIYNDHSKVGKVLRQR
jgi:hypothetical protein